MTTLTYTEEERSFLYAAFARIMYGETDFLKKLAEQDLEEFKGLDKNLVALLKEAGKVPEEELQFQYENLLYIPGKYYAPPFAGQYLYKHDQEQEEAFVRELAEWYEASGFISFTEKSDFRNDHIGHLLMFQHYLLMAKNEDPLASEEDLAVIDDLVKRTVSEVLNPAFGDFEKKVSGKLKRGFYLDAIRQMHQFIDTESREL